MTIPVKPCDGRFSEDVQAVLIQNKDRAQWAVHTCEVCGAAAGAVQVHGKWVPEQHWPSVKYPPREPAAKRSSRFAPPRENTVVSRSGSR
jgi:hypothetical protein